VVDRDACEFGVKGPVDDDRPWNRAVVNALEIGRNVRCFAMGDATPGVAAAKWQTTHVQRGRARIDLCTSTGRRRLSRVQREPTAVMPRPDHNRAAQPARTAIEGASDERSAWRQLSCAMRSECRISSTKCFRLQRGGGSLTAIAGIGGSAAPDSSRF
jgi:hypothetical protein